MTDMDPFLKISINTSLDRFQTESFESYMQRMAVLKAVAKWDEIKCFERDAISGGAEARTRVRLIDEATTRATLDECSDDSEDDDSEDDDSEDEVDDSVSVHDPVSYR